MAIGIVSSDEFDAELAKSNSVPPSFPASHPPFPTKSINPLGRGADKTNAPESLRKIIQEEALNGTPSAELESAFGVSRSAVTAYKNGATSCATYNKPDEALSKHGSEIRLKISSRAKSKILSAMRHISEDKLKFAKARDLAGIAKDMSAVVRNMEPNALGNGVNQNFVFYSPRNKSESDFDVITVHK